MTVSANNPSFSAEFEPAVPTGSRRRAPRTPVSFDAKLGRGGLDRALCRVTDLSTHGARLQTYSPLKQGSLIWLTLPRAGPRVAKIMWAGEFEAGCQFEEPMDLATYENIIAP